MSQRTQEELQRQLAKLGWTIGQQPSFSDSTGELIPLRQLATVTLREETPINASNQAEAKRQQPAEMQRLKNSKFS